MYTSSILFMYILALYKRFITCILLYFGNVHAFVGDKHSFQMRANVILFTLSTSNKVSYSSYSYSYY